MVELELSSYREPRVSLLFQEMLCPPITLLKTDGRYPHRRTRFLSLGHLGIFQSLTQVIL